MLQQSNGSKLAFHRTQGRSPGVIFLTGLKSDMNGSKAKALEDTCRENKRAYVRFDFFGHGQSDGSFVKGTIGRWLADTLAVLDNLSEGPQILVGSSMGGWVMLLAALQRPNRVAGLVGIAAAPDFTEELIWSKATNEMKDTLTSTGQFLEHSDYDTEPTPITLHLLQEARSHLLLQTNIPLTCPVRLLHGMADTDVPWELSVKLAAQLNGNDVTISLIKNGTHRLSEPAQIRLLSVTVESLCKLVEQV